MTKLGRPTIDIKKVTMSITINKELNEKLNLYLIKKKLSKSEYIQKLIELDNNLEN